MGHQTTPRKLWEHSDPKDTAMYSFMQALNSLKHLNLQTFDHLYNYSTDLATKTDFWDQCFRYLNFIYSGMYNRVLDTSARIDSIPVWFDGVNINLAENLLYTRDASQPTTFQSTKGKEDSKIAITEVREGGTELRNITWRQLRSDVARLASALAAQDVKKGDRIAVVASNSYHTLLVFLAVVSVGAIFSSSSTDMGTTGVLDRLLQITPKYVFMDDCALYCGKIIDLRTKMAQVVKGMASCDGFKGVVSTPRFKKPASINKIENVCLLEDFLKKATSSSTFFEATSFRDPFLIAYSSGTTGLPKCIVHSNGGALLNSAKETVLHGQLGPASVVLQYTTTGWIMYFLSVMNLFSGARVVLYDGSPLYPDYTSFIRLVGEQKVTKLGTSPRFLAELKTQGVVPKKIADLSNLTMVSSTGMVLSDQLFEWFYDEGFPKTCQLANIAGGTDIAGCFGQENPLSPVFVGGCQGRSLGTPVTVYDSLIEGGRGISGKSVPDGTPGELVAPHAFPNMPVYFWNDKTGSRYFSAYYEKYDNVWTHGDFVMIHPTTNQLVFLGRADGVLNPGGIRFGSSEIYSVLESRFPQISDSICVGQRRVTDNDESVLLFCLMRKGERFSEDLVNQIKSAIKSELSPRHVPKYVFETPEIPTTVNLKKVEMPVRQIVSGRQFKVSDTIANPRSLKFFYQFAEIEKVAPQRLRSRL